MIPVVNESDKPISITGIDKMHLKCDCADGSILDDVGHPILHSFALEKPPGHKTLKEPRIKLFKKIKGRSVSNNVLFGS